ncbi:MAG: hypothetical protein ACREC8_10620, partial [Limisphaerales bacterium]
FNSNCTKTSPEYPDAPMTATFFDFIFKNLTAKHANYTNISSSSSSSSFSSSIFRLRGRGGRRG